MTTTQTTPHTPARPLAASPATTRPRPAGRWHVRRLGALLSALLLPALLLATGPAAAKSDQEILVERAQLTVEQLLADPDFDDLKRYVEHAEAVLVLPQLIKGGFIVGGEGGSGVLLAKAQDGTWSPPAFYTLAAASIGLQLGGQVSQVVFTIMNREALAQVLDNQVKLGADVSMAVGPIGKGLEASTTANLDSDIYAFSKSEGLFGGAALEGALIKARNSWNASYYDDSASARAIVLDGAVSNPQADGLRAALP